MNNIFLGGNGNPFLSQQSNGLVSNELIAAQKAQLIQKMQQLEDAEKQLQNGIAPQQNTQSNIPLWNELENITGELNDTQMDLLQSDQEYNELDKQLGVMLQGAMVAMAKPIVEQSKEGSELLKKLASVAKSKKGAIVKQTNEELKLFNKFQEFAKQNPEASYSEFLKTQK